MRIHLDRLRENVARTFLGSTRPIDRLICCLLARGHALIEDVPGVGKTVLASALARSIDADFSRIQLTPDLLPADVLGVSIYERETGKFHFKKGPLFANIVLADEINRTTPRTQSALLEAMNEASVTIEGAPVPLPHPFMVLATQNPYEFEGTYLLPENQLDRFLMRISLGYPSAEVETHMLDLRPAQNVLTDLKPVLTRDDVIEAQKMVDAVKLDESLRRYIVELAGATRRHEEIQVGMSPRGALALAHAARATALLNDRDYAIPEDILENLIEVGGHRIISRSYRAGQNWEVAAGLLRQIAQSVPSPM
ncbi:MAG: AAA family ATPase [Phycisphaeraceae bacterium]|nr:AAA family ATPase [Phycisphaeraceae bacterium]MCW5763310.1 AAA family ATPase [Phycisphaeraceae bacterium]